MHAKGLAEDILWCAALPSHLLCRSANLYCNVSSRIADANHQHPLSSVGVCISILPAVKTPAREGCMFCTDRSGATGQWKHILTRMNEQELRHYTPPSVKQLKVRDLSSETWKV